MLQPMFRHGNHYALFGRSTLSFGGPVGTPATAVALTTIWLGGIPMVRLPSIVYVVLLRYLAAWTTISILRHRANPRRAGNKIWGKERVPPEFAAGNNCKDPRYQ